MDVCNPHLCRCFKVEKSTVQQAICHRALRTVDEVTDATNAGGACMCCHRKIEALLTDHWSAPAYAGVSMPELQVPRASAGDSPHNSG